MLIGRLGLPGIGELAVRQHRVRVGRSPACDLVVPVPSVAEVHAELSLHEGIWSVTDLGEASDTWVDGELVTGTSPIAPGSTLRLGQAVLVFDPHDTWADSAPVAPVAPPAPLAVSWVPRDEPMAPSFDWPARAPRTWWILYGAVALLVIAIVAFLFRSR